MEKILGIDFRSLMLFRQIIALLYIYTGVILRIQFFDFYSIEKGPFTNQVMSVIQNRPILTYVLHTDLELKIFLCFAFLVGVLLFLGILPSITSFVAMFTYSLLSRRFFPYFYGVDEIIVSVLFVLGFVFLIRLKKEEENKEISILKNPFVLLLLFQTTIIYWFNGVNKTDISWWRGEAVSMAAFNVFFNKPFALNFVNQDDLNAFLTYFTLSFELIFPILIFSKFKSNQLRMIAGFGIIIFHWGIHFFADVTLYKFTGIGFCVLLMPSVFWDKFPFFNKLVIKPLYVLPLKKIFTVKKLRILAFSLSFFLLFKAVNASIFRQNQRYKFIKNEKVVNIMGGITSISYSPFRQFWFMFAPSPPKETGYIGFDYIGNGNKENINLYGNNMPVKNFEYYHPFHLSIIIQFLFIAKGHVSAENQFVLFSFFEYYIKNDMANHPDRKVEDYELAIYKQTYQDFRKKGKYDFERVVIASYN